MAVPVVEVAEPTEFPDPSTPFTVAVVIPAVVHCKEILAGTESVVYCAGEGFVIDKIGGTGEGMTVTTARGLDLSPVG